MEDESRSDQQRLLEPVLQEEVPFKEHTITAVKLADGRYAVVLRWVCEVLHLDPQGQVQRIQRTAAIADELLRVKVQPRNEGEKPRRGGGAQVMPILTLRGFPTWILGIHPGEVKDDPAQPEKAEQIRQMIIAYQVEAVDALYTHFAQKARPALPAPPASPTIIPAEPLALAPEATRTERVAYYENLALWARWKANQEAQQWRGEVEEWRGSVEDRLEGDRGIMQHLIPELLERLGPEKISPIQQGLVRGYVKQLHEVSGKPYPTIYDHVRLAFGTARYQDLLASDWSKIETWFKGQIEQTRKPRGKG